MPLSVYPEDLTASLVGNYVVGETKVFATIEDRIFVPTGAPFYLKDLQVRDSATNQLLSPGVDYYAMQPDKDAMMASVKAVMTVIWVTRPQTAGVTIRYRAVGGDYQNLAGALIEFLDNTPVGSLGAPTWGTILNKPATFPPSSHNHLPNDWRGYTEVILLLEQIRVTLVSGDRPTLAAVYQHIEENISLSVNNYLDQTDFSSLLAMIQSVSARITSLEVREEVPIGGFIITDDPRNPTLYKGYGEWELTPNTLLSGLDTGGTAGQSTQIGSGAGQNVRGTFFWRRIDPTAPPPAGNDTDVITINTDLLNLNLRDYYTQIKGASNLPVSVDFVIQAGVLVTSSSTATPAVLTGDWPAGSTLRYINNGVTAGRGGAGGSAGDQNTPSALRKGGDGGPAILATYPLLVVNNNILAGGRGGGPALPSSYFLIPGNPIRFYLPSLGGGGGAPFGAPGVTGPVTPGPNIQPYPFTGGGLPQSGGRLIGGNGGSFEAGTSLFGLPQNANGINRFITANAGPGGRLDGALIQFPTGYNLIGGSPPGYTWLTRPGEGSPLYRDPDGNVIWYPGGPNSGVGAVGANGAAVTGSVTVTGNAPIGR